jgi:hypothetical protein
LPVDFSAASLTRLKSPPLPKNGQLETRLKVTEAALHAAEEETSAARARLAEADAMVAGEFIVPEKTLVLAS